MCLPILREPQSTGFSRILETILHLGLKIFLSYISNGMQSIITLFFIECRQFFTTTTATATAAAAAAAATATATATATTKFSLFLLLKIELNFYFIVIAS